MNGVCECVVYLAKYLVCCTFDVTYQMGNENLIEFSAID